ncbi:SMI1/KNR4 family protein [Hymenobacter terrenus]|uniref:SMI1/KNR4 family protein n=1 Tax=Hymenobacter terrenus TaxID=1629124 RepID=UPI000619DE61|nr:SMI1/KNR4 family protein [Hymenobacter terrenus]
MTPSPLETNPFVGTEQPATPADLEAIEQQYGFTLPEDYKAHLLRYNGGWPKRRTFVEVQPDGEQVERDISDFYSVGHGTGTLEESLEDLYDQLHPDLVPFGSEAGGDQFVLSVGPQDYGSVYYIGHEFYKAPEYEYDEETDESTPPAPLDYGTGVHFLAPSFTAFLDGLVEGTPV